jgi:hypothetical protein
MPVLAKKLLFLSVQCITFSFLTHMTSRNSGPPLIKGYKPLRNEPTTMDTSSPTELTIMLDNILVAISGG